MIKDGEDWQGLQTTKLKSLTKLFKPFSRDVALLSRSHAWLTANLRTVISTKCPKSTYVWNKMEESTPTQYTNSKRHHKQQKNLVKWLVHEWDNKSSKKRCTADNCHGQEPKSPCWKRYMYNEPLTRQSSKRICKKKLAIQRSFQADTYGNYFHGLF